ncbi:MAG: GDP-mannose 4,6-dehydratase, partial [Planctomycetales bacterium]|nr:GDP-mannose 4,6-dehydratase [Planctomycetales bacterium]
DNFNDYYDPALKRKNVGGFGDLPGVKVIEADFCDQAAMHDLFARENVKSVVHLGAYAGVHASVASPHVYQRNNVQGTLALLEAARQHPVSRFLLISSSTVYGLGAAIPFQEDAPPGIPASPYGATKRAAELMGLTYHQLHSVPVVCLRPFSVYGPRLRPDLAMSIFTQKIIAGQPLSLYGDGSVRRDFTHVSDICDGLTAALSAENVAGQAINLGHSHPVEIRQVIAMLESAIGKKAIVKKHPPRAEDLPVTFADLGKATRLLNYSPKVTFEEGIPEYVDWYRSWHKV